ncbi:hypothetical protein WJX73_006124 [Symbiochloris irregularis]|uniref:F-box domain-containing protein n=1 Tax=Symbiochloris irregularis TaxID=706552 RepID=A0AAW1PMU9_9CHLO
MSSSPALPPYAGDFVQHLEASFELQQALAWHMLPLLDLHSLAALACTCTGLRSLAYQRDELWRSAAASVLPPQQPIPTSRAATQHALQRRADIKRNIYESANPMDHSVKEIEIARYDHRVHAMHFSPADIAVQ